MLIINLFFIPVIAVYLYYRLHNKKIVPDFIFLLHWLMSCVTVSILAKLILAVERYLLLSAPAEIVSSKYSLAAFISAVLLAVFTKIFKIKVGEENNEEK